MGLRLIDAVFKSALPARLKPIAMVYAKFADDETGQRCHPGVDFVASALGRQPGIVRRQRNELIDAGVLKAEEVRTHGRRHIKVFAFDVQALRRYEQTMPRYKRTAAAAPDGTGVSRRGTGVTPISSKTNKRETTSKRQRTVGVASKPKTVSRDLIKDPLDADLSSEKNTEALRREGLTGRSFC